MILLEYNEKQGFHHNTVVLHENGFSSPLFSCGWLPVCPLTDEMRYNPELVSLIDRLEEELPPYCQVVQKILFCVMRHYELLKPDEM